MTAEIAILNRSAIALAADSAVQISVDGKEKVYDTAEKLFELSRAQPIALMVYNNVEYVGVPLDVLIRKFRAERADASVYATIREASDDFLRYLSDFEHDVAEERKYLYQIIKPIFDRIQKMMSRELTILFRETLESGKAPEKTPEDVLRAIIQAEIALEKARPLKGYLSGVSLRQFRGRFGAVVGRAADRTYKSIDIDGDILALLTELAFRLVKSRRGSDLLTGLVFGGFAQSDMFPTCRYLEIDGIFFGQVKILSQAEIDIDRRKKRAEVIPFAQKEMVERFMYGLDAELEGSVRKYFKTAINEVLDTTTEDDHGALRAEVKERLSKKFDEWMSKEKEGSRQDLLDIVYFMSKKELADIAYALVELTSQKRRFSTDEQTVGGPIDVAIITKSEGLVWIRRKHYFGLDVNQAYLSRIRNLSSGGAHDSKEAPKAL
jgi:hypothetical protein